MNTYQILDALGVEINRIIATQDFIEQHHAGCFRLVSSPEVTPARPALSKVDVMRRITPAEWHIFTTSPDPVAIYALAVFNATTEVHPLDPLTVSLFDSLEQIGILGAGRAAEILS